LARFFLSRWHLRTSSETLARRFTLFQGADFHLLGYLIPGERGELEPSGCGQIAREQSCR